MKSVCIVITVVSWLSVTNAWANEQTFKSALDNRVTVFGGVQIYQADGDFRSTKEGRPEIEVDMDDLDLDKNAISPIFGALINFGKRWTLCLDYFGYHDDSTVTSEFDFEFEDLVVPVGARVESSLDLDVYVANFAYNFISTERARLGVGVGVHAADIDLDISASVTVAGNEVPLGTGNADLLAPVPNIFVYGAYAFTEKFLLRYGGAWLSMKYGDYDGSLLVASAYLEYWPFQYVGLGAGYRYTHADIEYDNGKKEEEYDVDLPGPMFYVTFGF